MGTATIKSFQDETWRSLDDISRGLPAYDVSLLSEKIASGMRAIAYESNPSSSSAWSCLGFPLSSSCGNDSNLLVFAAASLNIALLDYILQYDWVENLQDVARVTALRHAASPFTDARFDDVEKCLVLLSKGRDSVALDTVSELLESITSANHGAMDPRVLHRWGPDIHARFVEAVLHLAAPYARLGLSKDALRRLVTNDMCPARSVDVLCKYAVESDGEASTEFEGKALTSHLEEALFLALQHSTAGSVISTLLDYGANPNFNPGHFMGRAWMIPLIRALYAGAPKEIVAILLQKGADPHLRCESTADTPFDLAKRTDRNDIVHLFLDAAHPPGPLERTNGDNLDASLQPPINSEAKDLISYPLSLATLRSLQVRPGPPSRSWFPSMAALPLARFRRDSKPI